MNESREFFKVPLARIIQEVELFDEHPESAKWDSVELVKTPWAELFSTFADDGSPRSLDQRERGLCADLGRRLKASEEAN